jgi:hypothetical protein
VDDNRLVRLEDKVDQVKDDVAELRTDFRVFSATIEQHVAGDNKIIDHIRPIISQLPEVLEIVQEYNLEKRRKAKREASLKAWSLRASVVSAIIATSAFFWNIFR